MAARGVVDPRAVAGRDPYRRRRLARERLGRRPEREGPLIRLVRLLEPQRHVQGEGELEEHQRDLAALSLTFQDRQELPVVADRLVERVLLTGAVTGDRQIRDGLVLVVGRQPVVRKQARDLFLPAFVPRLQPGGRLAVQAVSVDGDQRAVRGLLDERVLEPVLGLGPATALTDQVQPHQIEQRLPNSTILAFDHRLEEGQTELPPEHGRGHQRVPCAGVESVDPRQDDLLDRGRDLERNVVDEAPAVLVVRHRAGVHERPDQLLQEERIALGGLQDAALHVGGERALADERVEQLASGVARQRLQRHVGDPVRELAGRVLLRSPPRVIALQARCQHQQERGALRVAEEPLEQLERRGIRPVEILQHDGQRTRLRRVGR